MTYAPPGTQVGDLRERAGLRSYLNAHRFFIWDIGSDEEQDARLERIAAWCRENKVRAPSLKFCNGFAYPIFMATRSTAKALLFKLAFGGSL